MVVLAGVLAGAQIGSDAAAQAAIDIVDDVINKLRQKSQELKDANPTRFQRPHFGASWAGGNLGNHGTKAQDNVITYLETMADSLVAYRDNIVASRTDAHDTDENVSVGFAQVAASCQVADLTTRSTEQLSNQCVAPGSDD